MAEVPQDPFDALLTRTAAPLSTTHILITECQAPAYSGPEESKSREPIEHYPLLNAGIPDELTCQCVKQQIVEELSNSIRREDTSQPTPPVKVVKPLYWLEAVSMNNIHMIKEVLRLQADCNKFGVVVSNYFSNSDTADPSTANTI